MHTLCRVLLSGVVALTLVAPAAHAQRQLGKKKGPTSKLYLAETVGDAQITSEGRSYSPKQSTAFDAPGTVIETKSEAHQAFVYSNGTGMYVDADTRVEIDRFVQEPFRPDRNNTPEIEPSISQSDVFVARGQIGICTGQLVSGSTMNYATPHASLNIRGGKISIKTDENESIIYMIEGDATVRGGTRDLGGTLLRSGEQAVIRPGPPGQPPMITVGPIDRSTAANLDEKVTAACNARKTVSFETIERKSEEGLEGSESPPPTGETGTPDEQAPTDEIIAVPTTPANPPTNITVSPARVGPGE